MKIVWSTKFTYFQTRWRLRKRTELCPNALIYKTPLILRFEPLSLSRLMRYIVPLLCFLMKFHNFTNLKNAFYGREARFEIKKIENTLQIPLLLKNAMTFFHCKYFKIIKKPRWFPSKLALGNAWNRIVAVRTPVCLKNKASKNVYKTCRILMILTLDVNFVKKCNL